MAITGSGTQADPWIVHDYTELKTACERNSPAVRYVELANDINCNDYGADFVWDRIIIGNRYYGDWTTHLDLKGHTIKNVQVASNGYMFYNDNDAVGSTIKNGKILNVFLNGANALSVNASFENVSISVNGSGSNSSIFEGRPTVGTPTITSSAIYIEMSVLTHAIFSNYILSNADIKLLISDKNQTLVFAYGSVTDCRIRGKISGAATLQSNNYIVLGYYNLYGGVNCTFTNCVIDIDVSEMTYSISGPEFTMICPFNNAGYNTNAICKSEFPSGAPIPNVWNYMTHPEIRNGDTLRAKGFVVVNVSA